MLQCTQPILTAAASYFLLNEKLTFTGMSGAVIILACIISENILEKSKTAVNRGFTFTFVLYYVFQLPSS